MTFPNLSLHMLFDGVDMDVSELVRDYVPTDRAMSEDFGHAVSSRSIVLRYDAILASRLTSAVEIRIIATLDGAVDFTGRITPSSAITSRGASLSKEPDVDDIPVEADDLSILFDRQITDDDAIALENFKVCAPSSPGTSIVHFLCNLVGVYTAINDTIDVVLRGFSVEAGTVGEALSTLLSEYGYAWRLDEYGCVVLVRWMFDAPIPTIELNESTIIGNLVAERLAIESDAVEVSWTTLKDRSGALIYMADLPFGDDNRRSGWPIQPGYLYPEEANVDETWWKYDDVALANRIDARGSVVTEKDFTGIVLTKNHSITDKIEAGITREPSTFQNKRARIAYRCTATEAKLIYYCNILADVVYRGAQTIERANIATDPKAVERYDSLYIHDQAHAKALCSSRASRLRDAAWRYTCYSETKYPVGAIANLSDPYSGVTAITIIIERQLNIISGIYSYKAVGLSSAGVVPQTTTTTLYPVPDKRSTIGLEGVADVLAMAGIFLQTSTVSITRNRANEISPATIRAFAFRQGSIPYAGRFIISISHDAKAYQDVYSSSEDEMSYEYTVPVTIDVNGALYFTARIRVQLFAAGGFDTVLGTVICSVLIDTLMSAIYLGPYNEECDWPTEGVQPWDSLLDTRAPASSGPVQGGALRRWDGTAWVEYLTTDPGYGDVYAKSKLDLMVWAKEFGVTTIAAINAIFKSVAASEAFIAELSGQNVALTGTLRTGEGASNNSRVATIDYAGAENIAFSGSGNDALLILAGTTEAVFRIKISKDVTGYIGELGPGGGVIFYADIENGYMLEAAPADLPEQAWCDAASAMIDCETSSDAETGGDNTAKIVAATVSSAAAACANSTAGGVSGWHLPSVAELEAMYAARDIIGGFSAKTYFSSSESGNGVAKAVSFDTGAGLCAQKAEHLLYGNSEFHILEAFAVIGDIVYAFGYVSGSLSNQFVATLDTVTGVYSRKTITARTPFGRLDAVAVDGLIYITNNGTAFIEIYDPVAGTLTQKTYTGYTFGECCAAFNGKVYFPSNSSGLVIVYDIDSDTFSNISVTSAIGRHCCVVEAGILYMPADEGVLEIVNLNTGVLSTKSIPVIGSTIFYHTCCVGDGPYGRMLYIPFDLKQIKYHINVDTLDLTTAQAYQYPRLKAISSGKYAYVLSASGGTIERIDLFTGLRTELPYTGLTTKQHLSGVLLGGRVFYGNMYHCKMAALSPEPVCQVRPVRVSRMPDMFSYQMSDDNGETWSSYTEPLAITEGVEYLIGTDSYIRFLTQQLHVVESTWYFLIRLMNSFSARNRNGGEYFVAYDDEVKCLIDQGETKAMARMGSGVIAEPGDGVTERAQEFGHGFKITVSTSAPSGGRNGDIWFMV